jgi:hypothetical protein
MRFMAVCIPFYLLKSGIMEPEETVVTRQRLGKHFAAAMNTRATIEKVLDAGFSMWSVSY